MQPSSPGIRIFSFSPLASIQLIQIGLDTEMADVQDSTDPLEIEVFMLINTDIYFMMSTNGFLFCFWMLLGRNHPMRSLKEAWQPPPPLIFRSKTSQGIQSSLMD